MKKTLGLVGLLLACACTAPRQLPENSIGSQAQQQTIIPEILPKLAPFSDKILKHEITMKRADIYIVDRHTMQNVPIYETEMKMRPDNKTTIINRQRTTIYDLNDNRTFDENDIAWVNITWHKFRQANPFFSRNPKKDNYKEKDLHEESFEYQLNYSSKDRSEFNKVDSTNYEPVMVLILNERRSTPTYGQNK